MKKRKPMEGTYKAIQKNLDDSYRKWVVTLMLMSDFNSSKTTGQLKEGLLILAPRKRKPSLDVDSTPLEKQNIKNHHWINSEGHHVYSSLFEGIRTLSPAYL